MTTQTSWGKGSGRARPQTLLVGNLSSRKIRWKQLHFLNQIELMPPFKGQGEHQNPLAEEVAHDRKSP